MLQGVAGLQHWHVQNDGTCNKTSHLYCPLEEFLRVVWVIFLIPSLWNIHKPGLVNNRKKVATLSTCSCLSRGFPSLQKSLKCNVSAGKIFNLERIEPVRFLCIVIPVCDLVMNSLLGFSWCSGFNLYQPDPPKNIQNPFFMAPLDHKHFPPSFSPSDTSIPPKIQKTTWKTETSQPPPQFLHKWPPFCRLKIQLQVEISNKNPTIHYYGFFQ